MPDAPSGPPPPSGGSSRSPGNPGPPIGVRRPRWIPAAIVALSIAVVAVGALLVADITGWGSSTPQTTAPAQETRRAEVVAAVVEQSRRLDEAYATNNPDLLDDLYVSPNSPIAQSQKRGVIEASNAGQRVERITQTQVQSVTFTSENTAEVNVLLVVDGAQTVDAETGEVLLRIDEKASEQRLISLEKKDGSWKISAEDSP